MQTSPLTKRELEIIQDAPLLLAKVSAIDKIILLMNDLRTKLQSNSILQEFKLKEAININHGKISKGEKHQNLPYVVLDFPSHFDKKDIFTFRTIFWWGHEFSFSLLLTGKYKDSYAPRIMQQLDTLAQKDFYWCVNKSPWEHNFSAENYQAIHLAYQTIAQYDSSQLPFIKISRKLPIDQWEVFSTYGIQTYTTLIKAMSSMS